jgi:hypothetical protein
MKVILHRGGDGDPADETRCVTATSVMKRTNDNISRTTMINRPNGTRYRAEDPLHCFIVHAHRRRQPLLSPVRRRSVAGWGEPQRLRKENADLRLDRSFLKKAAAFFASDQNR